MRAACLVAAGALLLVSPILANALSLASPIAPTPPYFYDLNGEKLDSLEEGNQVIIMTTFRNIYEDERAFVGLIEVRDSTGITEFLAWQTATLGPLGNKTMGASWVVPESSAYHSRTFAISDLNSPQVLSNVITFEIDMAKR